VHGRCDRSGMSGRRHKLEVNVSDPSPTVIDIHAVEIENSVGSASTQPYYKERVSLHS
jgi:hypothetical protein